jgi:pyruvate-ferredoxin/flavodoxin oxidoreductase
MSEQNVTIDGNEAVAAVAYQATEVIAIYPITPSSPMGEWTDQWAAEGRPNLWGTVPTVVEMQSEGGAAGAVHGALQAGCLSTTFTASQGLLLMIPNMYKIAGELTPAVIHVAARALACQALSIFGDHSDVMAARATGFALLASGSVQEAADLALVAHSATLQSRIPFLHFFDGFRTSHEVMRIVPPTVEQIRALIDDEQVRAHRGRALSPDHPVLRGTAQNPDVYFQCREAVNPFYLACPTLVQNAMDHLADLTGRHYHLFDYEGAADAERVVVLMGSACETASETVDHLTRQGEKVGVLKVRLFRPFSAEHFLAALPPTVRTLVVLDRTKEPGSAGEPLYLDVLAALNESRGALRPRVIGGRYGLGSKEFTPAMVKAALDEAKKDRPRTHFTVGIRDDVTHTSLDYDPAFSTEDPEVVRAVFFALGSDGTVGANKNSIKIIGDETPFHAQGYFVYDSKKAGSTTVSHLRFGPKPIRSTYLIRTAPFVACHQFSLLERMDVLGHAEPGGVFLLNAPYGPEEVWGHLPRTVQEGILEKKLRFHVVDAARVAREAGMGGRINTVMQACFFALSGVLPRDRAIEAIKHAIEKTYGKRGRAVVERNFAAVDASLANLFEVPVPERATTQARSASEGTRTQARSASEGTRTQARSASEGSRTQAQAPARGFLVSLPLTAPDFVRNVTAVMMAGEGDSLPVSALSCDGTYPVGTTRYEKRNIAQEIPVWDENICIQCGKCVLVCPHAVIRAKVTTPEALAEAPQGFRSAAARWPGRKDQRYILQVAPEDCTGCRLCVEVCPAKNKSETRLKAINMRPQEPLRESEKANWDFFLGLPDPDRQSLRGDSVKDVQLLEPLFEFSGACAGCGETPYLKLLSQLFGDRLLLANATGCSSIYGGNLPTTPWTTNPQGRGPAWSNSLFEDTAEFGLGMRLAVDRQAAYARELVLRLATSIGADLAKALLEAEQKTEADIEAQRERVVHLREKLKGTESPEIRDLLAVADALVRKSVWSIGGDGWAYDIGYGGLDHVLASGHNVKVLVLDTEVYSNTGGQMSKATPRAAVAKFAAAGKQTPRKDLAMIAMAMGNVYVARVAMGGNDAHTLKAFEEAEAFDGPALIIAYSHCIAHGYDLAHGMEQQKAAVQSGYWTLLRYNPDLLSKGENPLHLDSGAPSIPLEKYVYNESRYTMLAHSHPKEARALLELAEQDARSRRRQYEHWAALAGNGKEAK